MERQDRETSEKDARTILEKAEYGVLSTVSDKNKPYGVPLNFCLINNCIYFHCALEGMKIDNILNNKSVSFCAVGETKILPKQFGTLYESAIVSGRVEEVFEGDKQKGLEGLLQKYSSDFIDKGKKYIKSSMEETKVFKITINKLTGKARKK